MSPYIKQSMREYLTQSSHPTDPGELAFVLTGICLRYLGPKFDYADLATIFGVLETVKLEFYRRVGADYEQAKCDTNGDVYPNKNNS